MPSPIVVIFYNNFFMVSKYLDVLISKHLGMLELRKGHVKSLNSGNIPACLDQAIQICQSIKVMLLFIALKWYLIYWYHVLSFVPNACVICLYCKHLYVFCAISTIYIQYIDIFLRL